MKTGTFRTLVVVAAIFHLWFFSLGANIYKLPPDIIKLVEQHGHGALITLPESYADALLLLYLLAAAGLLFFQHWARVLYGASLFMGLLLSGVTGVQVTPPLDAFLGAISWTLQTIAITIVFVSPEIRERFNQGRADEEQEVAATTGEPETKLVEVYESSDEAIIPVVESLFQEFEIEYSTAGENLQDLFAAGRLGGHNFAIGPVRFYVREEDAVRARDLLRDLQDPDEGRTN